MTTDHRPRRSRRLVLVGGAVAVAAAIAAPVLLSGGRVEAADAMATATLRSADGAAVGTVRFVRDTDPLVTRVEVNVRLPRAATGWHGLHVHANDNPANGVDCVADPAAPASTWFQSADGHFRHDAAEVHPHHAGDLPSVWVNRDGTGSAVAVIDRVQSGELFNRVVVLHVGPDNFGNVPVGDAASQYRANSGDAVTGTRNTGNAGDRLACGVIDVAR